MTDEKSIKQAGKKEEKQIKVELKDSELDKTVGGAIGPKATAKVVTTPGG